MSGIDLELTRNYTLLVKGFAIVKCHGNATILGADISNKSITIKENKVLPIETDTSCRITINRCIGYQLMRREGIGVSIWDDIRDAVLFKEPDTILIVGANDTGKSTLAVYLANIMLNKRRIMVIDGDVGQGDLAPPACIGASRINNNLLDLSDISAERYEFIGSITPTNLVIDAIKRLHDKNYLTIINTDGYIDKQGLEYKIKLINFIKPNIIACLGNNGYAEELLRKYKNVYLADKPRYVEKNTKTRLYNRLRRYKRFIGNNKRYFNITSKKIWINGNRYDCFIKNNYIVLEPFGPMLHTSLLKDMYVGLSIDEYVVGFGVIRSINNNILMQTDYEGEFDTIMLSNIKLSKDLNNEFKIRYMP